MLNEFEKVNKSALVVEGGAMRGIFSTGILDAFIKEDFYPFDMFIGVSAGANNLAAYLAGMYKRNYKVYTDYSIRPDFINFRKFIMGGHLVDLDWLWDITIRELKIDSEKIFGRDKDFLVGVTDINTGEPVYLKPDAKSLEKVLKASSSLPILYRNNTEVNGKAYADGGVADPIPVKEAYNRKAKKILVIRSRPYDFSMKSKKGTFTKIYLRKYPKLVEAVIDRPRKYREAIDFLRNPPKDVNIIEVNPPEGFQTQRLTKDLNILEKDYKSGFELGLDIIKNWK